MSEAEILAIADARAKEAATRSYREAFERELESLRKVQRVEKMAPPQPAQETDDAMWSVEKVASFLGMSKSWVYERAESGDLPAVRLGGRLRFSAAAIREYAQRGKSEEPKVIAIGRRRG